MLSPNKQTTKSGEAVFVSNSETSTKLFVAKYVKITHESFIPGQLPLKKINGTR